MCLLCLLHCIPALSVQQLNDPWYLCAKGNGVFLVADVIQLWCEVYDNNNNDYDDDDNNNNNNNNNDNEGEQREQRVLSVLIQRTKSIASFDTENKE